MSMTDEDYRKTAWRLIAVQYRSLFGICLKAADYDSDVAEEFMSDCVYEKMPGIVEKWINGPRIAPLEHYMRSMIYWYLRKHRARERKRSRGHERLIEDVRLEKDEIHTKLEVHSLLDHLKPKDRQMIQLVYFEGRSQQECADIMEISIGHVSGRLKRVFKIIRQNNPEWLD